VPSSLAKRSSASVSSTPLSPPGLWRRTRAPPTTVGVAGDGEGEHDAPGLLLLLLLAIGARGLQDEGLPLAPGGGGT